LSDRLLMFTLVLDPYPKVHRCEWRRAPMKVSICARYAKAWLRSSHIGRP
jgi:hypothetical protein